MHQRLKERLVGASVLIVIAVIFIPMILDGPIDSNTIDETNIPERPGNGERSKLVPITDNIKTRIEVETESVEEMAMAESAPDIATQSVESSDAAKQQSDNNQASENTSNSNQSISEQDTNSEKTVGLSAWVVQLGSFSAKLNADKLNLQLRKAGFPAFVEPQKADGKLIYRVRVGPELLRTDADKLLVAIKSKMELDGIVLRYP